MFEHHHRRPYLPNRIGDTLAVDIRGGAVHGLEHGGIVALGVEIGGRRDADGARGRRSEVREDVTEQVRRHHDVEKVGA